MVSLPGGNRAMITYVPRVGPLIDMTPLQPRAAAGITLGMERPIDSDIQELDASGNVLFNWHSEEHFNLLETTIVPQRFVTATAPAPGGVDLLHINSIDRQPNGDYVVSARHLDSVFRINHATGAVMWMLGDSGVPNKRRRSEDPDHRRSLGRAEAHARRATRRRRSADDVRQPVRHRSCTSCRRVPPRRGRAHGHDVVAAAVPEPFGVELRPRQRAAKSGRFAGDQLGCAAAADGRARRERHRMLAVSDPAPGAISYRFIKEPIATYDRQVLLQTAGGNAQPPP